MPRGPGRLHPASSFRECAAIATGIREHNAGKPMNRILLAEALDWSPAASGFRELIASAGRYGLVEGNYNSETIGLTDLGDRYTNPDDEGQRLETARAAVLNVPIFSQLVEHYKNNKLPPADILKGILEKPPFEVDPQWSEEVANLFVLNGREVGFVREVSGSTWVLLEAGRPTEVPAPESEAAPKPSGTDTAPPVAESSPEPATGVPSAHTIAGSPPAPHQRQMFVAFGKDRQALKQLQTILKELDIPYVVAEEEPNAGRPISEKVSDLMKACSAGIFIFSGDEQFEDKDGNTILKPRENVVFELGAASLLYGRRVVIFKEEGVSFPTDFRDLGYIEYQRGNLVAKSIELLKELVALKAIKIQAG